MFTHNGKIHKDGSYVAEWNLKLTLQELVDMPHIRMRQLELGLELISEAMKPLEEES